MKDLPSPDVMGWWSRVRSLGGGMSHDSGRSMTDWGPILGLLAAVIITKHTQRCNAQGSSGKCPGTLPWLPPARWISDAVIYRQKISVPWKGTPPRPILLSTNDRPDGYVTKQEVSCLRCFQPVWKLSPKHHFNWTFLMLWEQLWNIIFQYIFK